MVRSLTAAMTVALLLAAAWGTASAAGSTSLRGRHVEAVELQLPKGVEAALVEGLIEIREGEPFSLAAARRSVERLFQLDLFNEVQILGEERGDGLHLTIICRPKPRIRVVDVEGNDLFPDAKIQRLLRVTPGDEFVLEEVERRVDSVQLAYRRAGYHFARVLVDPETGDDEVEVRVRVIEGRPLRVEELRIMGRIAVDAEDLTEEMELEEGDVLDLDLLDRDREAIKIFYRSLGRFDAQVGHPGIEISRQRSTARVLLQVDAGPVIDFGFEGNLEIADADFKDVLHPEREERLSADVIDSMARSLTEYYERQGFPRATVEGRRERLGPDRAAVVFNIVEGQRVRLSRIEFLGNDSVDDDTLREKIEEVLDEEVARSVLYQPVDPDVWGAERRSGGSEDPAEQGDYRSQLPGRETYVRGAFELARDALTGLYKMRGFLDVKVGEEELEYSETGERLAVIVPIEEGPCTRVRKVEIVGARAEFDLEELREAVPLEDGAGLDPWSLEEGRETLRSRCRAEGYYFCAVEAEWEKLPAGGAIPVVFRIDTGPRVRVGRILVRGNIKTREDLVVNRLALRPGDLLLRSELARSRQRLIRTGLFYHATVVPFDPERPEPEKNLVVQVRERPDSVFELAGGVSSEKGPSVRVLYEELNLLGRGLRARASAQVNFQTRYLFIPSAAEADPNERDPQEAFGDFLDELEWHQRLERDILLGLGYPYLLVFRRFQLGTAVDVSVLHHENQPAFALDSHSLSVSVFTDPTERITGNIQFQLTYYDVLLASEKIGDLPEELQSGVKLPPSGETGSYSPSVRLIVDLRDDRFDPMSGILATVRGEYKRTFPDLDGEFLKGEAQVTGYIPLHRESRLRLALSARAGLIHNLLSELGDDGREAGIPTPVQDRFFLGGRGDLRSVPERSLYTEDWPLKDYSGQSVPRPPVSEGGDAYFLLKAELRRALIFGFEAGAFVDIGNLWLYPEHFTLNPLDLRYAAGLGLRFSTPVGPIAFDYGFNLNRRKELGEPFGAFHFSIGVF